MAKTDLAPELRQKIDHILSSTNTVLFMKGTKDDPQCGFSSRVVQTLEKVGVEFQDVNILPSPDLREGMKVYTDWPTFPQLYHKGQFIGGCDIVLQLMASGELEKILK